MYLLAKFKLPQFTNAYSPIIRAFIIRPVLQCQSTLQEVDHPL